jgi:hypothetical protein
VRKVAKTAAGCQNRIAKMPKGYSQRYRYATDTWIDNGDIGFALRLILDRKGSGAVPLCQAISVAKDGSDR